MSASPRRDPLGRVRQWARGARAASEAAATIARRELTLSRFTAKWHNKRVFLVHSAWRQAVAEWKRERVLLMRCAVKIQKRSQRAMMDGWLDFLAWRVHTRALLGKILRRLLHSSLSSSVPVCRQLHRVKAGMSSVSSSRSRSTMAASL